MTTPPATASTDAELIRTLWRRGRRAALIGAVPGLVVAAGLSLPLILIPDRTGDAAARPAQLLGLSPYLLTFVTLGTAIGMGIAGYELQRRMAAVVGTGPAARKIRQIVTKGRTPTSPEEQERAARFAALAAPLLPYQAVWFTTFSIGLIAIQVAQLLRDPGDSGFDLRWLSAVLIVLLLAVYAVLVPLLLRRSRRARAYSQAHPIEG